MALATSAGIAGERITEGSVAVAIAANALTTVAALIAIVFLVRPLLHFLANVRAADPDLATYRPRWLLLLFAQCLGAAIGIAIVHFVLRREAMAALPWLSERPGQLVNDAVAACGLLALVWASAHLLDTRLFVAALILVAAYRATAPLWHLDRAPDGFRTTVQEFIVAQFVAAAVGVIVFRIAVRRERR